MSTTYSLSELHQLIRSQPEGVFFDYEKQILIEWDINLLKVQGHDIQSEDFQPKRLRTMYQVQQFEDNPNVVLGSLSDEANFEIIRYSPYIFSTNSFFTSKIIHIIPLIIINNELRVLAHTYSNDTIFVVFPIDCYLKHINPHINQTLVGQDIADYYTETYTSRSTDKAIKAISQCASLFGTTTEYNYTRVGITRDTKSNLVRIERPLQIAHNDFDDPHVYILDFKEVKYTPVLDTFKIDNTAIILCTNLQDIVDIKGLIARLMSWKQEDIFIKICLDLRKLPTNLDIEELLGNVKDPNVVLAKLRFIINRSQLVTTTGLKLLKSAVANIYEETPVDRHIFILEDHVEDIEEVFYTPSCIYTIANTGLELSFVAVSSITGKELPLDNYITPYMNVYDDLFDIRQKALKTLEEMEHGTQTSN